MDEWRGVLMGEPLWLSDEDIESRTARELWEWHVKPARERARRLKDEMDGKGQPLELDPQTPDEHAQAVALVKSILGGS